MRLIDADAYLKNVCTYNETGCGSCRFQTACPADEPAIDAVPVIRCKDCKYYEPDLFANPWGVCFHWEWIVNDTGHTVDENGYCYRAERKEE